MKPILFNTEMVRALLDDRKTVTRRVVKPMPPRNARIELVGDKRHAMDLAIDIPGPDDHRIYTPPYLPGDILYVRETWSTKLSNECYAQPCHGGICPYESCESAEGPCFPEEYIYKASNSLPSYGGKWHPSIHMPKEAARIFLRVTDVRVERLQDIDGLGAFDEGAVAPMPGACLPTNKPAAFDSWSDAEKDDYLKSMATSTYIAKLEFASRLVTAFSEIWDKTISPAELERYGWAANPWVWVIEFERISKEEAQE